MDNRPVGVFDSGLGGLTAVRAIRRLIPSQDILYLGDTARVPYGGRGAAVITRYALEDMACLLRYDIKALVVACGTVSTVAMPALTARAPVPVLGVVEPSIERAVKATRNHTIGLIATAASVRSGTYHRQLATVSPQSTLVAQACPLFVPLVENGHFQKGDIVVEAIVAEYLAPLRAAGVDTLLLGCTHYPLLLDAIAAYMGDDVTLIDAGAALAEALVSTLTTSFLLPDPNRNGESRYLVTDSVPQFTELAALFLQNPTFGMVERVDIESV